MAHRTTGTLVSWTKGGIRVVVFLMAIGTWARSQPAEPPTGENGKARGAQTPTASSELSPPPEPTPSKATASPKEYSPRSTRDTVEKILVEGWKLPRTRVNDFCRILVRRATSNNADMRAVQYALGVLCLHHKYYTRSRGYFELVLKRDSAEFSAHVALIYTDLQDSKTDIALGQVLKMGQSLPNEPVVVDILAAWMTFLQEKPHPKLRSKANLLPQKERDYQEVLNDENKERYQLARKRTLEYIQQLPALRAKMLAHLVPIREKMHRGERDLKEGERRQLKCQQDYNVLQAQSATLLNRIAAINNEYDRLIGIADKKGNNLEESRLRRARDNDVAQLQIQVGQISAEMATVKREYESLVTANGELAKTIQQLKSSIEADETRTEQQLALPPFPYEPETERDKILTMVRQQAEVAPIVAKPVVAKPVISKPVISKPLAGKTREDEVDAEEQPPVNPFEEKKAKSLLSLADTLRAADKIDKAREGYQKVVDRYPNTQAANQARRWLKKWGSDE